MVSFGNSENTQRTDEQICMHEPIEAEIGNVRVCIRPLRLREYQQFIKHMAILCITFREQLSGLDFSSAEGWSALMGITPLFKEMLTMLCSVYHLPKRRIRRHATPDQIISLFLFTYSFNIDAVKKNISRILAQLELIPIQPTFRGGILKPRFTAQDTHTTTSESI